MYKIWFNLEIKAHKKCSSVGERCTDRKTELLKFEKGQNNKINNKNIK